MKTYRKNEIREHNYFYVGGNMNRTKHAQGKPGTSRQQDIRDRFSRIRHDEKDFIPFGYIDIPYITKARLEALEHDVKATLTEKGFVNTGNDHFEFEMNKKFSVKNNYAFFCGMTLAYAMDYCRKNNLTYTLTWLA